MTQDVIEDKIKGMLTVQYLASITANGAEYNLVLQDQLNSSQPALVIASTNSSCSNDTIQIDFSKLLDSNDKVVIEFSLNTTGWMFSKLPFTTVEGNKPAADVVSSTEGQKATITVDNVKQGSFWEYFINLEGPDGQVSFDPGLGGRRGS